MKKAFTLIELIIVIAVIGILSSFVVSAFRPNYHVRDAEFLLLKLNEARYKAIANQQTFTNFGDERCVRLKVEFNLISHSSDYKIKSEILPQDGAPEIICFDYKGRVFNNFYDGNYLRLKPNYLFNIDLKNMVKKNININVKYNDKICKITVYSTTGYAIMSCKK